jgi:hypothetical protein
MSLPPFLSVVAASRNDDHGGKLLTRMQFFIDGLADQCRRFGLSAELVLVEWNPPADRAGLDEALDWSSCGPGGLAVRIVRVGRVRHRQFAHSEKLSLYQMIAKNVGIRRACGSFVLATNIDILLSDRLASWLADRKLQPGFFYRVDRFDVASDLPAERPPAERLAWCADHVLRVARREGIYVKVKQGANSVYRRAVTRSPAMAAAAYYENAFRGSGPFLVRHGHAVLVVAKKAGQRVVRRWRHPLHTNASGDFTLMARDNWFALRGYPEFEIYSWHLDGVLIHQAHHRGLQEAALGWPFCVYHIDHERGSGFTPEGHLDLFRRLDRAHIPRLTDEEFDRLIAVMRRGPGDHVFNGADWGLAGDRLEEIEVA